MDNPNLKIENLKATFPDCVHTTTDQSGHVRHTIDFERLKKEIVASADCDVQERYSFTWPGKQDALRAATTPTKTTAQPCETESIDFDHSHNLFLEGDNLECLKHLLATHTQKIKMIYIDPPYNTGSEFLYSDNFSISKEQYCGTKTKGKDTSGMNSAHTEGRHHAQWLSMMYSRLKVARTLMSEDGVIFISIDDHEIHNLRKMCDEIFGAANFITTFCWEKKKKPSFLDKNVASKFEYICTYAKDKSRTGAFSVDVTTKDKKYPLNNAGNTRAQLTFPPGSVRFGIPNGTIKAQDMSAGNIITHLCNDVTILEGKNTNTFTLDGEWRYSQKKVDALIANNETISISQIPFRPNHIKQGGAPKKMHNLLTMGHYNTPTNEDAGAEQSALLGHCFFDYAKPVGLIELLMRSVLENDKSATVLDFFAGTSTTAHAVMRLNANDSGSRPFIMIQRPEPCAPSSAAYRAGYENIAELSKERLRRAGTQILETQNFHTKAPDVGFRVLKLHS